MSHAQVTEQPRSESGKQPGWISSLPGRTGLLALVLLLLAILTGVYALLSSEESTFERVARTGVIRIGYAVEAPFAFVDAQGQVSGESPAVARTVWQRLGIRTEWVQTDFASLIPQLRTGRFDQIASGLFIRPDRQQLVAFTQPSLCLQPALLVRQGNPLQLRSLADIAYQEQARLAVITGAVEAADAARAGIPGDRILAFATPDLAIQAMQQGQADALALSAPAIKQLAARHTDMQRSQPLTTPDTSSGCAAFAFRLTDKKLLHRFDQALVAYLGSREHLHLLQSFGLGEEELPPRVPAASQQGNRP